MYKNIFSHLKSREKGGKLVGENPNAFLTFLYKLLL